MWGTVWDYRSKSEVMSVKQCEDYISDLICDDDQKWLVASSGEGTITSFSLRAKKVHTQVRNLGSLEIRESLYVFVGGL